ncbi:hypothetical protein VIGAN_06110600 [Vigna angularis var. angularis]|uniref:Uncharacterized protein n=1 Tax=Vigna angularis var. angularis TaxID=157739 RepID=A0A0S3SAX5_PHAAN|nr:hypothetical protein VIGAN_06110600 [Vigna angularis var. angularis]
MSHQIYFKLSKEEVEIKLYLGLHTRTRHLAFGPAAWRGDVEQHVQHGPAATLFSTSFTTRSSSLKGVTSSYLHAPTISTRIRPTPREARSRRGQRIQQQPTYSLHVSSVQRWECPATLGGTSRAEGD